jgi:hypothetical protein
LIVNPVRVGEVIEALKAAGERAFVIGDIVPGKGVVRYAQGE